MGRSRRGFKREIDAMVFIYKHLGGGSNDGKGGCWQSKDQEMQNPSCLCVVMNINMTYCSDRFVMCTYTESSCCTHETNIMSYVNYSSVFKKLALFRRGKKRIMFKQEKELFSFKKPHSFFRGTTFFSAKEIILKVF